MLYRVQQTFWNAYQWQKYKQASTQDDHLQKLKNLIITGWPDTKDVLHADLKAYWLYRDELLGIDGITLKGMCIIIPTNLRCQIIEQPHANHMGIEKQNYLPVNLYIGPALMLILIIS